MSVGPHLLSPAGLARKVLAERRVKNMAMTMQNSLSPLPAAFEGCAGGCGWLADDWLAQQPRTKCRWALGCKAYLLEARGEVGMGRW
jgi:hypothetical protein